MFEIIGLSLSQPIQLDGLQRKYYFSIAFLRSNYVPTSSYIYLAEMKICFWYLNYFCAEIHFCKASWTKSMSFGCSIAVLSFKVSIIYNWNMVLILRNKWNTGYLPETTNSKWPASNRKIYSCGSMRNNPLWEYDVEKIHRDVQRCGNLLTRSVNVLLSFSLAPFAAEMIISNPSQLI